MSARTKLASTLSQPSAKPKHIDIFLIFFFIVVSSSTINKSLLSFILLNVKIQQSITVDEKEREKFQAEYNIGTNAFERGQYRSAIEHLEIACKLAPLSSRQGGEARIWLLTTYQAAGKLTEAIALARQLCAHPNLQIRQQSQRILYIIEAPKLRRPREWTVEMPEDLSSLSEANFPNNLGTNVVKNKAKQDLESSEPFNLTTVSGENNRFIWAAMFAILVIFTGLFLVEKM